MNSNLHPSERPFTAVLTSIFENVQEIVRSEARLVKAEVREEVAGLTQGAAWFVAGIVTAFFSASFLLCAGFFALSQIMPQWIAALIMAGILLLVSGVSFAVRGSIVKAFNERQTKLSEIQPKESNA
jgi:protein-S-isoprenylcysteine O-methyltransferase Ste14